MCHSFFWALPKCLWLGLVFCSSNAQRSGSQLRKRKKEHGSVGRLSFFIFALMGMNAHANVIQYFTGISYSNPAELITIGKNEAIIGATGFTTTGRFAGSALNFNTGMYEQGVAYTRTASLLPYGRIAHRYNDKLVFDVDVTQPFHSNLNWGNQSITRYAATQTLLNDVDVSPRVAYSFAQQFKIGAGIDFNFLKNNQTNWVLPVGPTTSANMVNATSGFGVGVDLGFLYLMNPTNIFGVTYYSKIRQQTRGYSSLQDNINTDLQFNFNMPATTIVSYVHIFNPKWLINAKVFYSEWSANQYARFQNTAAPPFIQKDFEFTMHFCNSIAGLLALHHQYSEKLGLTLIGVLDDGPERENHRPLNFPSDKQYFIALSSDYKVTKNSTIELLYGYGFLHTTLNNGLIIAGQSMPLTRGNVDISANVLDLKLKVQG